MNQLIYILILFSLLYLIETKAINILFSFVGIIISVSFILPTITPNIVIIESEYYSYILILVQVSALSILFGFIIMLFPNLSHSIPISNNSNISKPPKNKKKSLYYKIIIISLLIISDIIFFYFLVKYQPVTLSEWKSTILSFFSSFSAITWVQVGSNYIPIQEILNNINISDTLFLRKIGLMLYSVEHNIIKLIVLTIILLLAIISLFFLILII